MTHAYVAAGSNIDATAALRTALDALATSYPGMRVSPAYRNAAVGFEGDDFVNLAVELPTDRPVGELLGRLHEVEAACGRDRYAPKWAPRAMDLDVLLFGDLVVDEPGLRLPRPDLLRRAYMLRPMADLAPDLRHPVLGRTMRELWAAFDADAHPMTRVDLAWPR